jgi:hypothetical protein
VLEAAVAEDSRGDRLAATQHIVLVLRLVAQADGEVLYGEVMNAGSIAGERGCRFVGLAGIAGAVRTCVSDLVGDTGPGALGWEMRLDPNGTEHGPVG